MRQIESANRRMLLADFLVIILFLQTQAMVYAAWQ